MAIEIPEKEEIKYNETLNIGVERKGCKLFAYLEGEINDRKVLVNSREWDYYDAGPDILAKNLNSLLLSTYNMLLPRKDLEEKLKEVLKKFDLDFL